MYIIYTKHDIDVRVANACAGGRERWRNMGDKRNKKRKEGVEEERGATLQTKWVLFVDEKKKGRERERKTKKE